MQTLQEVQAIYDNWEQKVREETRTDALEEGRKEGRKDGLKEGEKRGLDRGRKDGLEEGRKSGLQDGIRALCGAFGIELTEDRERQLAGSDLDQLEQLMRKVRTHRRWPAS